MTTYVKTSATHEKSYIVIDGDKAKFFSIDYLGRRSEEKTEDATRVNVEMIKRLGYKLEY